MKRAFFLNWIFLLLATYAFASNGEESRSARIQKTRRHIDAAQTLLDKQTNEVERARVQKILDWHQASLSNILLSATLEEQEAKLAGRHRINSRYALTEAIASVSGSEADASKRLRTAAREIVTLRQKRHNMELDLRELRKNPRENESRIEEAEERLVNKEEEILLWSLERDAAQLESTLVNEAERIEAEIKSMPLKPRPRIKRILDSKRRISGEKNLKTDLEASIPGLKDRRAQVDGALQLARGKLRQIEEQIRIEKEKRAISGNARFSLPWFGGTDGGKITEILLERIGILEKQIERVDESLEFIEKLSNLYELEIEVLTQALSELIKRFWVGVLVPAILIALIATVYTLLSTVILPRFYHRDRLFIARRLSSYIAIVFVILVLATYFFEDLKHVATFLGIATAALVIALQDLCSAFAGWFVIVASRKVRVGDRVEIDGQMGDVIDIQILRTTLLELNNWIGVDQPTGRVLIVPNSFIFKSKVFNYSHVHSTIWSTIDVTVTFETPAREAHDSLMRILTEETVNEFDEASRGGSAMAHRYGIEDCIYQPRIYSVIADSGVKFTLLYVSHYRKRTEVRNRINARIIEEFDRNPRLNFAYPTERHIPTPEGTGFPVNISPPPADT